MICYPAIPEEYEWSWDSGYKDDIDIRLRKNNELIAWVDGDVNPVSEHAPDACCRNTENGLYRATRVKVDSNQEGVDFLAAQLWLGIIGEGRTWDD